MPQTILEMAKDLTLAMIGAGMLPPEQTQDTIQELHAFLMQLREQEGAVSVPVRPARGAAAGAVAWKKSITQQAIVCLECGISFKQLSKHLRQHGLDSRTYRAKYGIPRSQPLAAEALTRRRQENARRSRFWTKRARR